MQLLSLVPDAIVAILDRLDDKSLSACKAVCRALRDIIDENPLLQSRVVTAATGLVLKRPVASDLPEFKDITIEEQIERMRRYGTAWRELTFAPEARHIHMGFPSWFARQLRRFHPSGLLVHETFEKDFKILQLRGPLWDQEEQWRILPEKIDGVLDWFAVDPSQDLLVLLWRKRENPPFGVPQLSFRSLRSGEAHPRAAVANIGHPDFRVMDSMKVDVCDSVVMVHGPGVNASAVWIFLWKTGELVYQSHWSTFVDMSLVNADGTLLGVRYDSLSVLSYAERPDIDYMLELPALKGYEASIHDVHAYIGPTCTPLHSPFYHFDAAEDIVVVIKQDCRSSAHYLIAFPRLALSEYAQLVKSGQHDPLFKWDEWRHRAYIECWDDRDTGPAPYPMYALRSITAMDVDTVRGHVDLRILEFGSAASAYAARCTYTAEPAESSQSVDPQVRPASPGLRAMDRPSRVEIGAACTLRTRVRTVRLTMPHDVVYMAHLWENGIVLEGNDLHVFSLLT
ncbi:hypothetical protein BV20DRAFT_1053167 [Pilatotrama ljubarskyi]|nr:hypothetical protein BV20DRAFT_1053167 [Pilatotrama ljubarskyi]